MLGGVFAYTAFKKQAIIRFKALLFIIVLVLLEWTFHWCQYESLSHPTEDKTHELTIMSYNVFFKNSYKEQAVQLIREHKPDVLLIQELTPEWHQKLIAKLGKNYPYQMVKPLRGTHGIGVYAKHKLSGVSYVNNSSHLPIAQTVQVHIGGKVVLLTNLHLASPSRAVEHPEYFFKHMEHNAVLRKKQWAKLMLHLEKRKTTTNLVIGDANTLPFDPLYRTMRKSYVDLHQDTNYGFGWTFPNTAKIPFPFLRLDYALGKGELDCTHMQVLEGGSSDHLPILLHARL